VNDQTPIQTYGLYVSDDYKVSDKLKLVAAGRVDYSTIFEDNHAYYFSPRLAIVDSVSSNWTSKLMYNKATRYPSPWNTDLNPYYGIGNILAVTNPVNYSWTAANYLVNKPETLSAVEFQNIFHVLKSRISLTLYYQKLDDYYTWASPWTNVGDFEGTGAELDVKGQITSKLGYILDGATSHNNFYTASNYNGGAPFLTASDGDMIGVAQFSGSAGVDYQYNSNISLDLTLRYFTDQAAAWDSQNFPATPDNPDSMGYYQNVNYLDAGFQWKNFVEKGLALRLFGKNLCDNMFKIAKDFSGGYYIPRGAFYGMSLDYSWGS
jgi:outer membrane receptor for ferrienterochelin and colicin